MKTKTTFNLLLLLSVSLIVTFLFTRLLQAVDAQDVSSNKANSQTTLTNAFSYQGRLVKNNIVVNDACDFQFSLWDADIGGNQVGTTQAVNGVNISDGYFNVMLNAGDEFGSDPFTGDIRYLQINVKCPDDNSFVNLNGRVALNATPYALYAKVVPWDGLTGVPPDLSGGTIGPPRPNFARTVLDSGGDVGQYTSITVGADGLGLISYYDATNGDLKIAHCDNSACSTATITTIDSNGDVGQYTSITVGVDGLGLVSYYDATNGDLKIAHCDNSACSTATTTTIDNNGDVGQYTSITIGTDGLGLISYYDATNGDLKVAHCNNSTCTAAAITTIDNNGDVGQYTSITTGAHNGLGLISYNDAANTDLKLAYCQNTICTSVVTATNISIFSTNSNQFTSLTIGADGSPTISYYDGINGDMKVVDCRRPDCTSISDNSFSDSAGDVGQYSSITIGMDGLESISYYDTTNGDLKVAHCYDRDCRLSYYTLDSEGDVGQYTSITVGVDGMALISYYDATNGDLKVAYSILGRGVHSR